MKISNLTLEELLALKSNLINKLKSIPFEGYIQIKENANKKYIYIRKKENNKTLSEYIGVYSDELFWAVSKSVKEGRKLKKEITLLNNQIKKIGYIEKDISTNILLNIDYAKANIKNSIYDQAILEGIATTYSQIETIIENGKVKNIRAIDILKILNLKHAWEFILDKDTLSYKSCFKILSNIARIVNEGIIISGGDVRKLPVRITRTTYIPPIPYEYDVEKEISDILNKNNDEIDIAISLCLYCMKRQIFFDGNKRAAVIFSNHYLIANSKGILVIPYTKVHEFKKLLVNYYENDDDSEIRNFMKSYCWKQLQ